MEANYLSALRENVFKITSAAAAYETTVILDNAHKLFGQCKTLRTELEHTRQEYYESVKKLSEKYDNDLKVVVAKMQGARTVNDAVMREKPEIDRTNLATRFAQWLDDHPDAGPTYKKLFQTFLSTLPQTS